jgi:hypothetical protein
MIPASNIMASNRPTASKIQQLWDKYAPLV